MLSHHRLHEHAGLRVLVRRLVSERLLFFWGPL